MIDEENEAVQGLKNFQNNCYMNAIIQCLRGCEISELNLMDSGDWFKHMIALITKRKVDSIDLLAFIEEFFKTENHRQEFERHNLVPKMQADAREFLLYVLQNIQHKTTINFKNTFCVTLLETIEKSCKKHSLTKILDENMLNLNINSQSTQRLININESILRATPQNLNVVLNIFKFENNVSKKIKTFIELTNEINLSDYYEDTSGNNIQHYRLFGVCYHLGNNIDNGHYTSKLINKNNNAKLFFIIIIIIVFPGAVFNKDMNSWVYFNDSSVSLKTSLLDIVEHQPYILFYKKINSKVLYY